MIKKKELNLSSGRHLRFVLGVVEAIDLLVESDKGVSLRCIRILADTASFHAAHLVEILEMTEEAEATFR
ncbi:hypothetical protein ACLBXO_15390 [Methylobacterium sp. C33D]